MSERSERTNEHGRSAGGARGAGSGHRSTVWRGNVGVATALEGGER